MFFKTLSYRMNNGGIRKHPDLDGINDDVRKKRFQLFRDKRRGNRQHSRHAAGILRRQRRHHPSGIGTDGTHRLDVGEHPGAARRIHAGNRKTVGNSSCHFGSPLSDHSRAQTSLITAAAPV